MHCHFTAVQQRQDAREFTLDCAKVRLHLPAMKVCAVVSEDELPHLGMQRLGMRRPGMQWREVGWKQVHMQPEDSAGIGDRLRYTLAAARRRGLHARKRFLWERAAALERKNWQTIQPIRTIQKP